MGWTRVSRGFAAAVGAVALLVGVLAGPAAAEEPPFIDWNPLLPSLAKEYRPSEETDCVDGRPECIDDVIAEMQHRIHNVTPVCDHKVVFGVTYLRVTEAIRDHVHRDFFDEPDFLAHEVTVFARMYFEAYDHWVAGRIEHVPDAWRRAFRAADDRQVGGIGNLLMAMNAHVNRDMPYLLAALGLVQPDGSSRKPDHDRGNRILNGVYYGVIKEIAERFDPSTADVLIPGVGHPGLGLTDTALFNTLQIWREVVWRHAEQLVLAPTEQRRRDVAHGIERYASLMGELIRIGTQTQDSSARDAHCAANGGQQPGTHTRATASAEPRAQPGIASVQTRRPRADRRGRVALRVRCRAGRDDCAGRLVLRSRGERRARTLASRTYRVRAGTARTLRLGLGARDRRNLRSDRRLRSTLVLTRDGISGARRSSRRALVIRPR